jgi:hypothetical protein
VNRRLENINNRVFAFALILTLVFSGQPLSAAEVEDSVEVANKKAESYVRQSYKLENLPQNNAERLSLLYKAFAIMPDSNLEKASLAYEIAQLENARRKTETHNPAFEQSISSELKMRKFAAEMHEINDKGGSSQYWISLANCEASFGNLDIALEHAKHGIDEFTRPQGPGHGTFIAALIISRSPLIESLASSGKQRDAISLLTMAINQEKKVYGAPSWSLESQYVQLCVFLLKQHQQKEAELALAEILAVDPAKEGFDFSSRDKGIHELLQEVLITQNGNDLDLFIPILEMVLKSEQKYYGAEDYHVAKILAALGDLYVRREKLDAAEKCYRATIKIMSPYGETDRFAQLQRVIALAWLLEQTGRSEEAESLRAEREARLKEASKWAIPAEPNNSIETLENRYQVLSTTTPYSGKTRDCAEKLVDKYQALSDWQKIPALVTAVLKIQTQSRPSELGAHFYTYQISEHRTKLRKLLIEAYKKLGQDSMAQNQLEEAVAELPAKASTGDYVDLAQEADLIDDKVQSKKYWILALNHLSEFVDARSFGPTIKTAFDNLDAAKERRELENKLATIEKKQILENQRLALEREKIWPTTPAIVNWFPAVEQLKDTYCFNYCALASDLLSMKNGAKVGHYGGPANVCNHAFAGTFGNLIANQRANHAGQFSFIYDGLPQSLGPLIDLNRPKQYLPGKYALGTSSFTNAPAVPAIPFMRAPNAPATAKPLGA